MADRFRWPHWLEHNPLVGCQTDYALQDRNDLFQTASNVRFPIAGFDNLDRWLDA
jgi:hypothetical protein